MNTSFYSFLFDDMECRVDPLPLTTYRETYDSYNDYLDRERPSLSDFGDDFFQMHNSHQTRLTRVEILEHVKKHLKQQIKDINYAIAHPNQYGYRPLPPQKGIHKKDKEVKRGVYVLDLEGLPFKVYVGSSQNVPRRVEQHKKGDGAVCTKLAKGIHLLASIGCPKATGLDDLERKETLKQMYQRGIDKVRGWKFSTLVLSDEHKQQAFEDICCSFNLCLKCGEGKHFVGECRSKTKAKWCGGGPV